MTATVLELSGVIKDYRGLRPLRVKQLVVHPGDSIAILGLDQPMAEVFINLITGASLPDEGEVYVFGQPTTAVSDSGEWLALVDRFGIVSARAVLLQALSVIQNLSIPLTLEIEPPTDEVRARVVELAREVALPESCWPRAAGELGPAGQARLRVGRALALDPEVLLLEHVTAAFSRDEVGAFAQDVRALAARRGTAIVAATADPDFAAAVASRVLTLEPASGRLKERRTGWFARVSARIVAEGDRS